MAENSKTIDIVRDLTAPVMAAAGYELVDVEYQKEGKDWILRLFIDHLQSESDRGIGLDDCQKVSHLVTEILDEKDPIPGTYMLEVSSPGLERPLKKIQDYQRFAGHKAEIKLFEPVDGSRRLTGKLLGVADGKIVLETESGTKQILFVQVAKAHLIFEF